MAERLRLALAGAERESSVSVGLASYPADAADKEGLLRAVEEALDEAKRLGKDRVATARRRRAERAAPVHAAARNGFRLRAAGLALQSQAS